MVSKQREVKAKFQQMRERHIRSDPPPSPNCQRVSHFQGVALRGIKGRPSQWSSVARLDFSCLLLTGQQGKSELTSCFSLALCRVLGGSHPGLSAIWFGTSFERQVLGGFFFMEPVPDNMPSALESHAKMRRSEGRAVMGFWAGGSSPASLGWGLG